jgi:hypothetical protein
MSNESFEELYRMNSAVAIGGSVPFPGLKISKANNSFPLFFFICVGI